MISKKRAGICTLLFLCAVFIVWLIFIRSPEKESEYTHRISFFSMDTFIDVRSKSDITDKIRNIFSEYDKVLDCRNENAETAKLNSMRKLNCSDILCGTVKNTLMLNEKYGVMTDITVGRLTSLWNVTAENPEIPGSREVKSALETIGTENIYTDGNTITLKNGAELDFGAVGKGAALDSCFEYLKENNSGKTIISTGSSLLLYGADSFDVDIVDPDGNGSLAKVRTNSDFLSTSGGYERYFEADGKTYCHIIDPRTGYPAETDLTTVTVFCDSGIGSDFLSTMIFTEGSENIKKYLDSPDYKIFAADKNKKLYVSSGLDYEVYNEKYSKADNKT